MQKTGQTEVQDTYVKVEDEVLEICGRQQEIFGIRLANSTEGAAAGDE